MKDQSTAKTKATAASKVAKVERANTKLFTSGTHIRETLRSRVQDADLVSLRNQLTVRNNEGSLSPQDTRVVLVQDWLNASPGAHEIFDTWERTTQAATMALCASIVASVLSIVSSQFIYLALGQPVMKTLLTSQWTRRLSGHIGGAHTDLVLATLKLYNAMVSYAGGREQRAVMEVFPWDFKSLPKLLFMRRKKKDDLTDMLVKPDIRTLYVLFIMTFLDERTPTPVKLAFLERHREAVLGIFKGLHQDPYSVVQKVLETFWSGLWYDVKIKRSVKIAMFGEVTMSQLLKIYDRAQAEDADPSHIPADVVHHFLLALSTRPGTGVCFRDQGWYPRDESASTDNDKAGPQKSGKIYNKILANLLKGLKVNEDSRQQELAIKILTACPELVAGYWGHAALTLEPRLSSKWIANMAFFGSIILLPVPVTSFLLPSSTPSSSVIHRTHPPPSWSLIENVLPALSLKAHFSKGLQSTSRLVQHCTALALIKCLYKLESVLQSLRSTSEKLEEDETGLWRASIVSLEKEARKRMPDFQVVVAFSLQTQLNPAQKYGLLGESAQRLLWLYHHTLPSIVAEARFDVGKLVNSLVADPEKIGTDGGARLDYLRQLHTLRLLQTSDQFAWTNKAAGLHSPFNVLLTMYLATQASAVRSAVTTLLRRVLSDSILFQHDPAELDFWLRTLPVTTRGASASAPDGTPLTDEGTGVIAFLEDCVQRCTKTPYRYIEDLQSLVLSNEAPDAMEETSVPTRMRDTAVASPLLMTVLEQLEAKSRKAGLLSPSDTLAIFTFVRKLALKLISNQEDDDLRLQRSVLRKLKGIVDLSVLTSTSACIGEAVERDLAMLARTLEDFQEVEDDSASGISANEERFLSQVEEIPIPSDMLECRVAAFELVDWLRLGDRKLNAAETIRVLSCIAGLHVSAVSDALFHLRAPHHIWDEPKLVTEVIPLLNFHSLFLACDHPHIMNAGVRDIISKAVLKGDSTPERIIRGAFSLVLHRVAPFAKNGEPIVGHYLVFLVAIASQGRKIMTPPAWESFQQDVAFGSSTITGLCISRHLDAATRSALAMYVETCQSGKTSSALSNVCQFWLDVIRSTSISEFQSLDWDQMTLWVKYMLPGQLFEVLSQIAASPNIQTEHHSKMGIVVDGALSTLHRMDIAADENILQLVHDHFPHLLALRGRFARLTHLWDLILSTLTAYLPAAYHGELDNHLTIDTAEARWIRRVQTLPFVDNLDFLLSDWQNESTARIIAVLSYTSAFRRATGDWLRNFIIPETTEPKMSHSLALILQAYIDAGGQTVNSELSNFPNMVSIFECFADAVLRMATPETARRDYIRTMSIMFERFPSSSEALVGALKQRLENVKAKAVSASLLLACCQLRLNAAQHKPLLYTITDLGLQWAARRFSEPTSLTSAELLTLDLLTQYLRELRSAKSHLVEPALISAISGQLHEPKCTIYLQAAVEFSSLKPVVVNRQIQNILQHSVFRSLCLDSLNTSTREHVVHLLHTLFNMHPTNTCQVSHLQPLVDLYGGLYTSADRRLLSIFYLFEGQRKLSCGSVLQVWSASAGLQSKNALDALLSLDPSRVFRTCLAFLLDRRITPSIDKDDSVTTGTEIYDPIFICLLLAQMFAEGPPTSALNWVELFRTNVFSLVIRCLSSKEDELRDMALDQLAHLRKSLETADMHEKPHVEYIIHLLRDVVLPTDSNVPPRLPTYSTLLLAHALRGIFYPANFIYPLTARFLLQRPALDIRDVPMLFGMLYSSTDNWKKERTWIVRFLADGFTSGSDWQLFKRRHTWDLLASLYQSSEDRQLRRGVLEVLAQVTSSKQAATSLVLKSLLLPWAEMQIATAKEDEFLAWARILENIVTTLDASKVDSATGGEWRAALARCVAGLLTRLDIGGHSFAVMAQLSRLTLRIATLSGDPQLDLPILVSQATIALRAFESTCSLPDLISPRTHISSADLGLPLPPFSHYTLHEMPEIGPNQLWGICVQSLWQACMASGGPSQFATSQRTESGSSLRDLDPWDALTCRLLIFRSLVGPEGSSIGEWARVQVIGSLQ